MKIFLCQPPLPQPLLPLESGRPPCPPARWPTSGWRAAARSSPAWTRCPGSSICKNHQSLSSSFSKVIFKHNFVDAGRHPEYQLWQAGWKVMGAFKKFSCQNQQEWKRPTARRRSDREHLPLVLLRSCWCKYKTAQMEMWLQSYLTVSSYKLV